MNLVEFAHYLNLTKSTEIRYNDTKFIVLRAHGHAHSYTKESNGIVKFLQEKSNLNKSR
jgi:hypothetical protein